MVECRKRSRRELYRQRGSFLKIKHRGMPTRRKAPFKLPRADVEPMQGHLSEDAICTPFHFISVYGTWEPLICLTAIVIYEFVAGVRPQVLREDSASRAVPDTGRLIGTSHLKSRYTCLLSADSGFPCSNT